MYFACVKTRFPEVPLSYALGEMKHILITIAAVVLVGCGPSVDIHQAAEEGNIEAVKQHLAAGMDVDVKDKKGRTPLHRVSGSGYNKEIAELLITKGADVNAKASRGWTPLHYVAFEDRFNSDFTLASKKEITALLIAKGADVNVKNNNERTPLHFEANGGHKEIVEILITEGADVNAKGGTGDTPLHNAVNNVYKDVVELLIAKGADVNAKNMNGMTPLHVAAYGGAREHFELLIAKGADVNAIIKLGHFEGRTPLDFAIAQNSTKNTALLRKHGGKTAEELKAEGK
jgi:cytohesin